MNKFLLSTLLIFGMLAFACNDDEEEHMDDVTETEYSVAINSPSTDDKNVNDDIHIHTVFESATAQTIHHVNIRIYNVDTNEEIYNGPADAHVHQESGMYEIHDDFSLTNANGVEAHSDWILEAKVWGHEAGLGEVVESIQFHVHPE